MENAAMPSDGTATEQLDCREEPHLMSEIEPAPVQEIVQTAAIPSDGSATEPSDFRKEPQLVSESEPPSSVNEPPLAPVSKPVTELVPEPTDKPPIQPVE